MMSAANSLTSSEIKYGVIYTDFKDKDDFKGSWGFTKRSNGNWVWSRMDYSGVILRDKETNVVFSRKGNIHPGVEQIGITHFSFFMDNGEQKAKEYPFSAQLWVTNDLFNRIFPNHPGPELKEFTETDAMVTANYKKAFYQAKWKESIKAVISQKKKGNLLS